MSDRAPPPKRRLRRLVVPAALVAAIALAVLYLRCGGGFGLGGGSGVGLGKGPGSAGSAGAGGSDSTARGALDRPSDAGVPRCQVRVTGAGLELDGAVATREAIVAACRTASAADVTVTGDARQGVWDDLKAALTAAGIATFVRDPQAAPTDAAP